MPHVSWVGYAQREYHSSLDQTIRLPGWSSKAYASFANRLSFFSQFWTFFALCRFLSDAWSKFSLEGIVVVDYGALHLWLLKRLKRRFPNLKVIYISPPKTWASRSGRLKQMRKLIDVAVVVYPFERRYFESQGIHTVLFKGLDCHEQSAFFPRRAYKTAVGEMHIVCYPGSRASEVKRHLPIAFQAAQRIRSLGYRVHLHVSQVSNLPSDRYYPAYDGTSYFMNEVCPVHENTIAWVCSGTMTAQVAAYGIPMIVFYHLSWFSYWVLRSILGYKGFIALPNIEFGAEHYPELIGPQLTITRLVEHQVELMRHHLKNPEYFKQLSMRWIDRWNQGAAWTEEPSRLLEELACHSSP